MPNPTEPTATIRYAGSLRADQEKLLTSSLKKRFAEIAEVRFEEDASLIGGIRIVYRDYIYDDSLLSRLTQLRNRLAQ